MKILFITFKMLWKRIWANAVLVFEILLSIIMLAQLFVFVMDHVDNMRAINELPMENTVALNVFDYYDTEDVINKVKDYPQVSAVDRVYMGSLFCNNVSCNLVAYSDEMISRYKPALQAGEWLPIDNELGSDAKPAVLSADIGLKVGESANVTLSNQNNVRIKVVGILEEPTQYLFPSGSASSPIFSAASIIKQDSVVIMKDDDVGDTTYLVPPKGTVPENLFIFLKPSIDTDDTFIEPLRKYGEITPMPSLVSTYNRNTTTMIGGGTVFFVVFFFLAATCVLSNQVIQSIRNRRIFTVYYLNGMDWKMAAIIEILRIVVLVVITMALTLLAGNLNLLMLEWMTPKRTILFYGITFLYIIIMFVAISARFLAKLIHSDISVALKDLQQGE